MESLPNLDLLKFNADTLQEVRKAVNLSRPGEMKEAIDIIEEWVKQQNHFTKKDFDRRYLESVIILSKGSLERAQSRLDRACTLRTMMADMFRPCDIRKEIQEHLQDIHFAVLPKLNKDNNRVHLLANKAKKLEPNILTYFSRVQAVLCEYIRIHDYSSTYAAIIDYTQANLSEISRQFTVPEMRALAALFLDCHGFRVKGVHIISNSKMISMVVDMIKQVIPAKIGNRIQVHTDLESLYNFIDKDMLPKEYGGQEKSLIELHDAWIEELMSEEHQNYCREIFSAKTDESKRQTDTFNEQYLGMPGSFRTFNVD